MLQFGIFFLLIAVFSGVIGFGVALGTVAVVFKASFVVFLVLFLLSLLDGTPR